MWCVLRPDFARWGVCLACSGTWILEIYWVWVSLCGAAYLGVLNILFLYRYCPFVWACAFQFSVFVSFTLCFLFFRCSNFQDLERRGSPTGPITMQLGSRPSWFAIGIQGPVYLDQLQVRLVRWRRWASSKIGVPVLPAKAFAHCAFCGYRTYERLPWEQYGCLPPKKLLFMAWKIRFSWKHKI